MHLRAHRDKRLKTESAYSASEWMRSLCLSARF
jgi:hypothetical protein